MITLIPPRGHPMPVCVHAMSADALSVTDGGSFAPGTKTHSSWKKNGEAKRAHCSSVFLTISEHCQQIVNAADEDSPLAPLCREDGREGGDQVSGFKGSVPSL